MIQNERASTFVMVTCPCGRSLRAKSEQAGTEVRCWDCHKMVPVPVVGQGKRVARELSEGVLTVVNGPGFDPLLASGVIITAVLALPYYGTWCSVIVLTLGASVYGEVVRRVSRGAFEGSDRRWLPAILPRSIPKLLLCLLLAAGTVVPLWIRHAGFRQQPHWDGIGRAIAALTWMIVPLLILMTCGRNEEDVPLGFRRTKSLVSRHPISILLALAVVPVVLLLVEILLGLVFYFPGKLPFFALDFMPMPLAPEKPVMYDGLAYYHLIDYRSLPDSTFIKGYFQGIWAGYTFVGSIPSSLSNSTRGGMKGEAIGLLPYSYTVIRILLVMSIVSSMLAAFAIQARWLGSIAYLDRRRTARATESSVMTTTLTDSPMGP